MPKIGEHRKNARNNDQWWTICMDCGRGFWGAGYNTCLICTNQVGRKVTNSKGDTYIKLAEDDPYYSMTAKNFLYFGAGWVRECRYVMAQSLGRCLTPNECVFRKNKDKTDSSPDNLYIQVQNRKEKHGDAWEQELGQLQEAYEDGYRVGHSDASNGKECKY